MSSNDRFFRGFKTDEGLFGTFYIDNESGLVNIASLLKLLTIEEQKALIKRIQFNIKILKARKKQ